MPDDNDDEDVSDLINEFKEFKEETDGEPDDDGAEEADEGDVFEGDPEEQLEGEAAEMFEDAFSEITPDNPELLDLDIDDAQAQVEEEPDEPDDDDEEAADEEEEDEECEGSSEMQLTPLGQYGDLQVMLNYLVADTVQEQTVLSSEPDQEELADLHPQLQAEADTINDDLESDEFIGSRQQMLEIHFDELDADDVHDAIAHALHPTEDKLARNPDAEITPESLWQSSEPSCHEDYERVRTFDMSREGDSAQFIERGPWTGRRFNVEGMIDELRTVDAESEDGIMLVTLAVPFK